MTGNLSRTVLRGEGTRESAFLPDLTNFIYDIQFDIKNLLINKPVGFSITIIQHYGGALLHLDYFVSSITYYSFDSYD